MRAAGDQPIKVRMRPGLDSRQYLHRSGVLWVITDPITRQYHWLRAQEHEVLQSLTGKKTFNQLKREFESRGPGRRLDARRTGAMISQWHREGLVESIGDDAAVLLDRAQAQQRQRRWSWLANPLFIRLPGFDPRRLLDVVTPWTQWIFSGPVIALALLSMLAAVGIAVANIDRLVEERPLSRLVFDTTFGLQMLAVAAGIKILHELGHAVACRRVGAAPKEMGIMLMLGMPCLYCDVSDAWRLHSRFQVLLISAAGIYVECTCSAIATLGWIASRPGWVHTACAQVMILGSVNTLLLNGNPLLRYDGYYLLADATGTVNLWSRSRSRVKSLFASVFGLTTQADPINEPRENRFLLAYGLASMVYRTIVLIAIVMLLYAILKGWGLGVPAGIVLLAIVGFVAMMRVQKWIHAIRHRSERHRSWMIPVAIILILGILCFPIPNWTHAPAIGQPDNSDTIYVTTPGILTRLTRRPGQSVRRGEVIAELDSPSLRFSRNQTAASLQQIETQLADAVAAGSVNRSRRTEVPRLRAEQSDLVEQLERFDRELEKLTLRASRDGVVYAVPRSNTEQHSVHIASDDLPSRTVDVLSAKAVGSYLEIGTKVCVVASPDHWKATIYLDDDQADQIAEGATVTLRWRHCPDSAVDAKVENIAETALSPLPDWLLDLEDASKASADQTKTTAFYPASLLIQGETPALWSGVRGRAKIWLPNESIMKRLKRSFAQTFQLGR